MSKSKVSWGKGTYGMMKYVTKVAAGSYELVWQGDTVTVTREVVGRKSTKWWLVKVNGADKAMLLGFDAALDWVANVWGNEEVDSQNLMNGKPVKVRRSAYGGVCDPGTESYWSM